ncbi:MAG: hypothetical protein HKN14_03975 [Marinicaulis sp.]|nr:hypothetical protein [Marinicaulis sp.]NNL89014.1 hypothetical protein [Marinicaulis sp.]
MSQNNENDTPSEEGPEDAANKPQGPGRKSKKADREERLAQALRDNLRRRKAGRKKED